MIRNNKGMTLLEIMIVLVILGGLITILAGQVNAQLEKSKVGRAKIQMGEYGKALDAYNLDCNTYPTTEEGLQALMEAPSSCTNWGPEPYLKKLNKDPWDADFQYENNGEAYVIKSFGKDKREGGTGYAQDLSSDQL